MHIVKAFTHLQVRKIPEKYILKRYTRHAREEVAWDRHDAVRIGPEASQEQTRLSKLIPMLMKLGRAGSVSDRAYNETVRLLQTITPGVEMFRRSSAVESKQAHASPAGEASTTWASGNSPEPSDPLSDVVHDGMTLIEPTVCRTKGRKPSSQKKNVVEHQHGGNPLSTYNKENYGNRMCHFCNVVGTHYSTTCALNPDRSRAAETRSLKSGAKTQGGPPRKRGRPKIVRELHEESGMSNDEQTATQESNDVALTSTSRGGTSRRGRGARTAKVSRLTCDKQ